MIVEQAFQSLPETLCGSTYPTQEYEQGVVVAFTLSVLQELNGRNVANPLSCIQAEHRYRHEGKFARLATPRHLRADLSLNLKKVEVGNSRLYKYGYRDYSWLEAKFLRGQTKTSSGHASNKTAHTASFIADLLRLTALTPFRRNDQSNCGLYFLHVYDDMPEKYLVFRNHPWLKRLTTPGRPEVADLGDLNDEGQTVKRLLGEVLDVRLKLHLTNFVQLPRLGETTAAGAYHCFLSRIDGFELSRGKNTFSMSTTGALMESPSGARSSIAAYVAEGIHKEHKDEDRPDDQDGGLDSNDEDETDESL